MSGDASFTYNGPGGNDDQSMTVGPGGGDEPSFPDAMNLATGGALDISKHAREIAPLDQLSAQRIASHAGLSAPTPQVAAVDGPMPDVPPVDQVPPDMRYHYTRSLLDGDTSGPLDFAERTAGAAWGLASSGLAGDDHDENAAMVTNAAKSLAGALPHPDDLDIYASHIMSSVYGTGIHDIEGADEVRDGIAQNLAHAWQDTGITPDRLIQRANVDPDLAARLAVPPPQPIQQSPHFPTLEELSVPARDAIHDPLGNMMTDPTGGHALTAAIGLPDTQKEQADYDQKLQELTTGGMSMGKAAEQLGIPPMAMAFATDNIAAVPSAAVKGGLSHFFPTVGSAEADATRATIRRNSGISRNVKDIASDILEPFRSEINKQMPSYRQYTNEMSAYAEAVARAKQAGQPTEDIPLPAMHPIQALYDHLEDRPGGGRLSPDSPLYGAAETIQGMMKSMRQEIERHYDTEGFIENYVRHMYDSNSAFDQAFGAGRRGSSASLNQRTIPYLFDAMVRGLKMKYPDPIDNALQYIQGMSDHLASERTIHELENAGQLQWARRAPEPGWVKLRDLQRKPQAPEKEPGAEPSAQPRQITDDTDVALSPGGGIVSLGRGAGPEQLRLAGPAEPRPAPEPSLGWQRRQAPNVEYAWAHPATATIYNNWAGRGFNSWARGAPIFQNLQRAANMSTALKLGLSGAHMFNIAHEVVASGLANAFGEIRQGELVRGLKDMGMTATLFPRLKADWSKGENFQNIYLGKAGELTPVQAQMRKLYIEAGGRPLGRGQEMAIDRAKNLFTAWKQGGLPEHFRRMGEDIATGNKALSPARAVIAGAQLLGDVSHTLSAPLFDNAIPKLKVAAWANEMEAYIRAHPNAADEELSTVARRNLDSIDDRYGEMNMENVFLPRYVKQVANTALLSTGWWYGTMRAFGRGAADLAMLKNTTRARWLLALPLTTAMISTIYQGIKTGQTPSSFTDLIMPRTGGMLPSGEPERAQFLSPWKEFFDNYSGAFAVSHAGGDPAMLLKQAAHYVGAKANPALRSMIDFATSPEGHAWWKDIVNDAMPIIAEGSHPQGATRIDALSQWLGFRQGARAITEPTALGDILNRHHANAVYQEQLRLWRQDQSAAEPQGVDKPNRSEIYNDYGVTPKTGGGGSSRGRRSYNPGS